MMNKKETPRLGLVKYLFVLPVSVFYNLPIVFKLSKE